ncbi:MAG: hypothetical protein R2865_02390 [Deinococcales bacterium]
MQDDLGWSKATLSFATALGLIIYGFSAPLWQTHAKLWAALGDRRQLAL